MERKELTSVAGKFYALRGWLLIPTGLLFLGVGIANLQTGDVKIWFPIAAIAAIAGYFVVNRYYVGHFGKVDPSPDMKTKTWIFTVLSGLGVAAGLMLDMNTDLPISAYGASFAGLLLVYYQWAAGLKLYHWLTLGGLLLLCLLPIWGGLRDGEVVAWTLIAMGVATIVTGVLDHRQLVTAIGRARSAGMVGDVHVSS